MIPKRLLSLRDVDVAALIFAWGPTVDLAETALRFARGRSTMTTVLVALVAVIGRQAIARWAFGPPTALFRLAVGSLLLGAALRIPVLAPLASDAFGAGRAGTWLENFFVVPTAVALYATLLGLVWRRGFRTYEPVGLSIDLALALLWLFVPQVNFCFNALWENEWTLDTVGAGWWLRVGLGVIAPVFLAAVLQLRSAPEGPGAEPSSARGGMRHRLRFASMVLHGSVWIVFAICTVIPLTFVSYFSFLLDLHPYVAASARARDGTRAVVVESADDPYDVDLWVQAPDQSWSAYRVAGNEDLEPWDIAFDDATLDLSLAVWDLDGAVLRARTRKLERRAPLFRLGTDPFPGGSGPFGR
jgi:hypothetical protein